MKAMKRDSNRTESCEGESMKSEVSNGGNSVGRLPGAPFFFRNSRLFQGKRTVLPTFGIVASGDRWIS